MRGLSGPALLVTALVSALLVAPIPVGAQPQLCFGREATIVARPGMVTVGTAGADVIVGTGAADVIRGGGGADRICSKGGDDQVFGLAVPVSPVVGQAATTADLGYADEWARRLELMAEGITGS